MAMKTRIIESLHKYRNINYIHLVNDNNSIIDFDKPFGKLNLI